MFIVIIVNISHLVIFSEITEPMGTKLSINVCKPSLKFLHFVIIEEKTWEILGKNLMGQKLKKNLITETTETIGTKLCKNDICDL